MYKKTFEQRIIDLLGKSIDSIEVNDFVRAIKEKPYIDKVDTVLQGTEIQTDYCFYNSGLTFIFNKDNKLSSLLLYLIPYKKYNAFNKRFNTFVNFNSTKNELISKYGTPSRKNDNEFISFGTLTPVWIAYDHENYTIHYSFVEPESKLAKITIMTTNATPGRKKLY